MDQNAVNDLLKDSERTNCGPEAIREFIRRLQELETRMIALERDMTYWVHEIDD